MSLVKHVGTSTDPMARRNHVLAALLASVVWLGGCGGGQDEALEEIRADTDSGSSQSEAVTDLSSAPDAGQVALVPKEQPSAGEDLALLDGMAASVDQAETAIAADKRERPLAVASTAMAGPAPTAAGAIGKFSIRHTFPGIEVATTPISLAHLNATPAGANGRITVVDGHLHVEGKRVRLYGINMPVGAFMPNKNQAKTIAARLAKEGFNAVRAYGFEQLLAKPNTYTISYKQQGVLNQDHSLNKQAMDSMDYFVHELQQAGIYVSFPLHTSRVYLKAPDCIDGCEGLDNYLPALIQEQKDFAAAFLNHVNPYTGKAYRDDPGVFAFEINNENSLTHRWSIGHIDRYLTEAAYASKYGEPLQALWRVWLQRKYVTEAALGAAWGQPIAAWSAVRAPLNSQRASTQKPRYMDWLEFMADTESTYKQQMYAYLKDTLKVGALVYGTQTSYNQPFSRDGMDMADLHTYYGDLGTPAGRTNKPRNNWPVTEVKNLSAVDFPDVKGAGSFGIFQDKALGKPNIITEFAYRDGNQHAAEAEPLMSTYAGFQDLDAVFLFNYHGMNMNTLSQTYPGWYNMSVNAVTRVSAALAFRRGDVAPGAPQVLKKTRRSFLETMADNKSTRAMNFHFGGDVRAPYTRNIYTEVVSSAAQEQIVKGGGSVDGAFTATTGQIVWRPQDRITVDSPRTKLAIGRFNNSVVGLGSEVVVTVGRTMNNYAVMSLSSLDATQVLPASRMLFSIAGHFTVPGEFPRKPGEKLYSWGNDVPRIEAVPATVRIKTTTMLTVTALDATGARRANVPVVRVGEQVQFMTGPAYDTGWYLIEATSDAVKSTDTASAAGPVVNSAPTVSVSAPASATIGAAITLAASASDRDGSIVRVEFYDGATLIGTDTSAPYSLAWTPTTAGNRSLSARAIDNGGASKTAPATTLSVAAARVPDPMALESSGVMGGLRAEYFANANLQGASAVTRFEVPSFDWEGRSPAAVLPTNFWSARWTGYIVIPVSGRYTFQIIADDGLRAQIGGQWFANKWSHSGNAVYTSATLNVVAGARIPVRIEHYDGTGASTVRLRWKTPSSGLYWPDVPASQLTVK